MEISLHAGDFVWTRFPYEDDPDNPGPVRHAACVIAVFNPRTARVATTAPVSSRGLVVGVYTSSQVEKFGDTLPIGVIQVQAFRAGQTGDQPPFFIDVRKRAFIPFTRQFFPEIDSPGHGLIGPADKGLLKQIIKQYQLVNDRHSDLIVNVGPLRPCPPKWSSKVPTKLRQWIFAHPMVNDVLGPQQFELREVPIPQLQQGQALVRVKLVNIHSGTRARMANGMTKLGDTDRSNYACAEVMQSRDPTFKEGDVIACQAGWQDFQIVSSNDGSVGYATPSELVKALNGSNSQWNYVFRPAMVKMWPPEVLMEMFGTSGMTAYFGMRECGPLMPKDCVAVAGATGSVGSIAAQLARIAGCFVVGFAGGADRCKWVLDTLGINACIDYRAKDFEQQLKAAFPNGIDVYSDGIGGALTETVTGLMNRHGRLFSYGGAAAYYADKLDAPQQRPSLRRAFGISETIETILKQSNIKSECWIVDQFYHERLRAEDDLSRHLRSGALKPINHVVEGFENLPRAVVGLYTTARSGKLQVRFDPG